MMERQTDGQKDIQGKTMSPDPEGGDMSPYPEGQGGGGGDIIMLC